MSFLWIRGERKKINNNIVQGCWNELHCTGASNLRPRNIFVRPNLDSEFKEKSVIWPIFLRFLIDCGPKYEKNADLRPKDQLGLDAPELHFIISNAKHVRTNWYWVCILNWTEDWLIFIPKVFSFAPKISRSNNYKIFTWFP